MERVVCQLQGHLEKERRGGESKRGLCNTRKALHGRWVYRPRVGGSETFSIIPVEDIFNFFVLCILQLHIHSIAQLSTEFIVGYMFIWQVAKSLSTILRGPTNQQAKEVVITF